MFDACYNTRKPRPAHHRKKKKKKHILTNKYCAASLATAYLNPNLLELAL